MSKGPNALKRSKRRKSDVIDALGTVEALASLAMADDGLVGMEKRARGGDDDDDDDEDEPMNELPWTMAGAAAYARAAATAAAAIAKSPAEVETKVEVGNGLLALGGFT